MALDEPEEDDLRLEVDGHKFIMHPQLQEDFGKFAVDYVDSIFDRFIVTVDF